ncbi:MAG: beta-lactamase family protein [Defluviitaleaceae bacterium]|nr:beta-lactamase family protein [Defluviitaleaceae bacterium]
MKKVITALAIICIFAQATLIYAAPAEPSTPTGIPLSQVGERIDAIVAAHMESYTPGFAVAVVHEGEIIFSRGYGHLQLDGASVCPSNTVFEFGSIHKLFVYISVMQLVEQGLIDLDAYVREYLPADFYRELNFQKPFTVRDLLNHSAGFGEFFFYLFANPETIEREYSLREGLLMSQPAQIFEPGTASSYSNFGSALLGYIVSYVSGTDFSTYERENILAPLGMTRTKGQPDWFAAMSDPVYMQNKAVGHMPNPVAGFASVGEFSPAPWAYVRMYPAGSIRGTAEDLAQLAIALTPPAGDSGPLFADRAALDLMLSPSFERYSERGVIRGTHHGFLSYNAVYPAVGHSGGTVGFNADFTIVPSERFGLIMLTNANGGLVFMEKVSEEILGSAEIPAPAGNLPDASRFAGNYFMLRRHEGNVLQIANMFTAAISVETLDENTISVTSMGLTATYRQVSPYTFRVDGSAPLIGRVGYEIEFLTDNGKVTGISMTAPFDATSATFWQSPGFLIAVAIGEVLAMLFFFIAPVMILIRFLRKKEKSPFILASSGFVLSGTLLAINNTVMLARILSNVVGVSAAMVNFHIWINFGLTAIAVALFATSVVFLKRGDATRFHKILFCIGSVFIAIFAAVLWYGNSFSFV